MYRNKTLRSVAALAVLAIVAAACGGGGNNNNGGGGAKKTVKIGFFGALTGAAAGLVVPGYKATQLAFEQANAGKFGDLPVKVEVVGEDTQGDPTVIPPIATKVANDQSFVAVMGPNFSGESAAAGPTFDGAGIPFVTGSATNPTLSTNGWTHWFRAQANDNSQAPTMADYIANVLKPNCAYVLSDDTTYGKGLGQIGLKQLQTDGVTVKSDLGAIPNGGTGQTKDFSSYITKIKQSGCSALFYGGYSPESGPLRKQMTDQGLTDVTMVGGDGMEDGGFLDGAGTAGEGTIATCPCGDITTSDASTAKTFVTDFTAKYGEDPTVYAPDYWDIAQILIGAFKAGKTTRADLTTYLDSVNYTGISKTIQFQPNHELVAADAKIYIWKDVGGKWTFQGLSTDVIPA